MLKFTIKITIFILFFVILFSCDNPNDVKFLVSSNYLKNMDSIKTQTPYKVTNIGSGFRLSNLPMRLNGDRNAKDWDEITEKHKVQSFLHIDSLSKTNIVISRTTYKWLYKNEERVNKRINIEELKILLASEGIKSKDIEIKNEIEVEYDGGSKTTHIELYYKGTVNQVSLSEKGIIDVHTYLVEQIPYWESKGHQFSTTTPETIEKQTKHNTP
jgi:hypothetical protein